VTPLFPVWTNAVVRACLGLGVAGAVGVPMFFLGLARAPYTTYQFDPIDQPVQFDHRHHVRDEGIRCLYCHYTAKDSPNAGVPPTSLCMNCHSQVWNAAIALNLVRRSYFADDPIAWNRVHNLPDFVFFDHSAHVARGVGCESCHGRVDLMGLVYAEAPLTMSWCLDCHRNPDSHIRPKEDVTVMGWKAGTPEEQAKRARDLGIAPPIHCSGCHR
jgi:Cytochrome c7 and related cytochrome c